MDAGSRYDLSASPHLVVIPRAESFPDHQTDPNLVPMETVVDLPSWGVRVCRLPNPSSSEHFLTRLRAQQPEDPAFPIQRLWHLGDPTNPHSWHMWTNRLCVQLSPSCSADQWVSSHGARLIHSFASPGAHLLEVSYEDACNLLQTARSWQQDPDVHFAHPDWIRPLPPRETLPNDPMFLQQWYLKNIGQGGGSAGADLGVTHAWDLTLGDPNLAIAVIDTGVAPNHPDLNLTPDGYNPLCGAGPLMGAPQVTGCGVGFYSSNHGTSVAGVVAGRTNNGIGISGIAGQCQVIPINLLGVGYGYGTPSMEAMAFDYAVSQGAAVITNSWGPDGVPWPLPGLVQAAFLHATSAGRGGLGTVIFWAAGNGAESISSDGYASSPLTISVGASNDFDLHAGYSDFGPELDCVAPSSGGSSSITTTSTDASGAALYTSGFGGTSAAAPMGAGVAALMLSVNPALTWEQVRDLMRATAVQIDAGTIAGAPNTYDPSTGHSEWYGYGRLDAHAAVLAAQAETPGVLLSLTTTGAGDGTLTVTRALPGAELFIPFSLDTTITYGSGPVVGLGLDALNLLFLPLPSPPVHVLASGSGQYTFMVPPGSMPSGLGLDMRALEVTHSPFALRMSGIRRVIF